MRERYVKHINIPTRLRVINVPLFETVLRPAVSNLSMTVNIPVTGRSRRIITKAHRNEWKEQIK